MALCKSPLVLVVLVIAACGPGADDDGPVVCEAGFVVDGAAKGLGCIPIGPLSLTGRSADEVCSRFAADQRSVDEGEGSFAGGACDAGAIPQAALDNGLRRVNLYRWLAGVDDAALAPGLFPQQQACATMMAAHGQLTHTPSPDVPCYSALASDGAGSSNISSQVGLGGSVDLYMSDFGDFNAVHLGHRRWTIGPRMSVTQFGVKDGYSCMYVFGYAGGADPGFVAWPPPGFVPVQAPPGDFSYESIRHAPTDGTTVEVAVDDGAFETVEHRLLQEGYGAYGTALAFAPPGGVVAAWVPGKTIRVRVVATADGDIEYTVKFSDCAP
ncbi:MAG: hypothetical protein Q8O67_32600 [Deltaproteobacteria bacterium]|nr:hypothetical protein [Deltaproteobacteria bacterium]